MAQSNKKIIIIGGGWAGTMAALWCREVGWRGEILLLERTSRICSHLNSADKSPITLGNLQSSGGHGQCGEAVLEPLLRGDWTGHLNYEWLKELGVSLWKDASGVFGASSASSLVGVLEKALSAAQVEVLTSFAVETIGKGGDGHLVWSRNGQRESGARLLWATGGERNHALKLLRETGHEVQDPCPGFLRLRPASRAIIQTLAPWSGLVSVRLPAKSQSETGQFEINGRGIEGDCLSALTYQFARKWRDSGYKMTVEIDFLPLEKEVNVQRRLRETFSQAGRRPVSGYCPFLFEERFWKGFLFLSRIDPDSAGGSIRGRQIDKLGHRLKSFSIAVSGMGLPRGERCNLGGLDVSSILPATLESRFVEGLYFAGEVLNFQGAPRGDYLNMLFASSHIAATALVESLRDS